MLRNVSMFQLYAVPDLGTTEARMVREGTMMMMMIKMIHDEAGKRLMKRKRRRQMRVMEPFEYF